MLSYRHAFHAGNAADVLKHAVLVFVLDYLKQKTKPLYLIDTHAGAGLYDLLSDQAAKTGEAEAGIQRVLNAPGPRPDLIAGYEKAVRASLEVQGRYPGSPALLAAGMGPEDRLDLCELHPTDYPLLAGLFGDLPRVRVSQEDGFRALIARMPPQERRGLAVVDPSYEIKSDYSTVVTSLKEAHKRFATGVYMLWYPVIERARTDVFLKALEASGLPRQLRIELSLGPDMAGRGMTGFGLVVINPPYVLEPAAAEGLAWMSQTLGATGPARIEWLVAA
ncbi:MAG: 23S rRNA (adenine(2030)-N(6))-methyltransferase RlmJ [Alphaproteobacteria bacterium]